MARSGSPLSSLFRPTFVSAALLLLISAAIPAQVQAQATRYVTDSLDITMRSGASTQHRITKMLRSGTRVQVLDQQGGWVHIKTPDGKSGWVLGRFLINQPVARERLAKAEAKLARLLSDDDSVQAQLNSAQEETEKLNQQVSDLSQQNQQLQSDLTELREATKNTVTVLRANKLLKQQDDELKTRIDELEQENTNLSDNSAQTWFIRGAGVGLVGLLLGVVLPRLPRPRKKRSSWDRL